MGNRNELAEKLELVGSMFEIDGMSDLLRKFDTEEDGKGAKKPINPVKFNAVVIQIESLLMRGNQHAADKIISMSRGISEEEVEKLDDADYANALKSAIITDVLGFFASSPSSAGRK